MSDSPAYPRARGLLEGRTVLITAAAGTGIGSATARRCLEEGARVMLSDAHASRLDQTVKSLAPVGKTPPLSHPCDVTVESQVQALWEAAVDQLGHVDVLVNNAGLGGYAPLIEMQDEQWARVLDVTLTGTMRMTRAAFRHMLPRKQGAIVNNASVLGWRAQAGQSHYAAAKAGVMALTRCAAKEGASAGVRVNAVAPSLAMHPHLAKVTPEGLLDQLTSLEAFGRAAEPFEVANVILFLASDLASYMTGEVLAVSSQRA